MKLCVVSLRPSLASNFEIEVRMGLDYLILRTTCKYIQWSLSIKDTLDPPNYIICPLYRGCTLFRGEKCISTIGKSTFGVLESVLSGEVVYMASFIGRIL